MLEEIQDGNSSYSTIPWSSVVRIATRFKTPLENVDTDVDAIHTEFEEMVDYAIQFLSLSTMTYQAKWWHLFTCLNLADCKNCLNMIELLFSLPASKGKMERIFSQLKRLKMRKGHF